MRRIDLTSLSVDERRRLLARSAVPDPEIRAGAARIVAAIRNGGDEALREANTRFGGGLAGGRLRVPAADLKGALAGLSPGLHRDLEDAAAAIRQFHDRQVPSDDTVEVRPGVTISRRWAPIRRAGVYVPGGKAAYPSSLLMGVIPAQVAGVPEIVVTSPAAFDGSMSPVFLAAAAMLGVDEVYATGGAQAIAALAYGTETIPAVDKIVGPGNPWVTAAKLEVLGETAIDLPAGASEALVVADADASPRLVAADLLCQSEHGGESPAVLVTDSAEFADRVTAQVEAMLPQLSREAILREALDNYGLVAIAPNLDAAIEFANDFAAEHVSVQTAAAASVAESITKAGSVFVGPWSPHSAGDYATGGNHVLPTGGLAGSYGPLSVGDFGSYRQVQELTREGLAALRRTITGLAEAEGLTAHRLAVDVRFEEESP